MFGTLSGIGLSELNHFSESLPMSSCNVYSESYQITACFGENVCFVFRTCNRIDCNVNITSYY